MRTFPSERVPDGWFQIGWVREFEAGVATPLDYFGRELVAYRTTSGELRVLDAYCPHMGAHLGHTGCIEGDRIRCGYHGWLFDADGRNVEIPYDMPSRMNVGVRRYPTQEIDGLSFVYFSYDDEPPRYELPETFMRLPGATWPISSATTRIWRDVPIVGQFVTENTADVAHFKYVHMAHDVARIADMSCSESVICSTIDIRFGGGMASTWATPQGPVDGHIYTESWGLGIGWSRLVAFDDVIFLACFTPTAPDRLDFRTTTWVAQERGDGSTMDELTRDKWVAQQNAQVESDMRIWRTQTYVRRAPMSKIEQAPMRMVRNWADQFYSDRRTPHGAEAELPLDPASAS